MRRGVWAAIVAVFGVIAVAAPVKIVSKHVGASSPGSGGAGRIPVVRMAGVHFSPGTLVARKGTTVTFDNDDVVPHTVTEDTTPGVDSGLLSPGKVFHLVFDRRLSYHCSVHPFMQATIELAG